MKAVLASHLCKSILPFMPKVPLDHQLFVATFIQLAQLSLPFIFIQLFHLEKKMQADNKN